MATDPALEYYDGPDLEPVVLGALREAGRDVERLAPDDLAQLDEFHALGRPATLAQAEMAELAEGERVLDLGAGIGGPSRVLARHFGARVTALDPTERFCALNEAITARTGLADRIQIVRGDARELPFADGSFDLVWTQAVLQNIEDKARVAAEVRRVLAPGGRWALFEVAAGPGGALVYPVPWGDGPEHSFLLSAAELRATLESAGLPAREWRSMPEAQAAIMAATSDAERMASGVDGISLALVMPNFEARMGSLAQNVGEGRIELVQAVVAPA
jgi:ubiquinone/menaquinone biosynthesis C-methylase UbiE